MEILTEAMLRSKLKTPERVIKVLPNTYITPEARRYAAEQGFVLDEQKIAPSTSAKPEDMTNLNAHVLVKKAHPRITLRGQIDAFEGELICLMCLVDEMGRGDLVARLEEVLNLARQILASEVKETPLPPFTLFGMTEAELRENSHHPEKSVGIPHTMPNYRMGKLCAGLNHLRAKSREVELCAVRAFENGERIDLIRALNRISSAIYILYCKEVAAWMKK